jgi:hypothetical protein
MIGEIPAVIVLSPRSNNTSETLGKIAALQDGTFIHKEAQETVKLVV